MSRTQTSARRSAGRRMLACFVGVILALSSVSIFTSGATAFSGATLPSLSPDVRQGATDVKVGARQELVSTAYGRLPLQFEANEGQADERFDFIVRAGGYSALLSPDRAAFVVKPAEKRIGRKTAPGVVSMNFLGSNAAAEPEGVGRLPGRVNHFRRGKSFTGIHTYTGVRYQEVYAGVDVTYYGNQNELEHDFTVRPGGSPDVIEFELKGGKRAQIDQGGGITVSLPDGDDLRMRKPFAYQEVGGVRREVPVSFVSRGGRRFGFKTGEYDRARELVIDPVLSYSTFLGGSGGDRGFDITVDAQGNAYVTGSVTSVNFPVSGSAYQKNRGDIFDAFVTKLNPAGTAVVFSTYLGGGDYDVALSLAVDSARNVYVSGATASTNFPTTAGAFQRTLVNQTAFVTKLSPQGDALLYSTLLGGKEGGSGAQVAADAAGDIYLAGTTSSADFPTTPNAYRPSPPAPNSDSDGPVFPEGFLAKIHPAGGGSSDLVYSTFFGGNSYESVSSVTVDAGGRVYVAGSTVSTTFPTTPDAVQPSPTGSDLAARRAADLTDGILLKMDPGAPGAAGLVYSTHIGGTGRDHCSGVALDPSGNVYLTGYTRSQDFPTTRNALQTSPRGGSDAFVVKLNTSRPGASGRVYATYLGGSGDENIFRGDIAVDSAGNAYLTGETSSTDLPVTVGAFQPSSGGVSDVFSAPGGDAFVAKLNAAGTALVYFTYLGGKGGDGAGGIALDARNNAYLTGSTFSDNFPLSPGAAQPAHAGSFDVFVARVDNPSSFVASASAPSVSAAVSAAETLPNPIDDAQKFVRQQYLDFLNREPDPTGLAFWTGEITQCGADAACVEVKRINVSAAFFLSIEFQQTGFLIHRLYRASHARAPRLVEFAPDTRLIREGVVVNAPGWELQLEANKRAFVEAWVQRTDFRALYDGKGNAEYVDALFANAGVQPSPAERGALIDGLTNGAETRATVLRKVAENAEFERREFNKAFVQMQYFGYLQRSPDDPPDADLSGYDFWLSKLEEFDGNFIAAEMVKAFVSAGEYRKRFGQE